MLLPCGCESKGEPVPVEKLREHWEHTLLTMLFWELTLRPGANSTSITEASVAIKRTEYLRALCKAFPEVFEGLST